MSISSKQRNISTLWVNKETWWFPVILSHLSRILLMDEWSKVVSTNLPSSCEWTNVGKQLLLIIWDLDQKSEHYPPTDAYVLDPPSQQCICQGACWGTEVTVNVPTNISRIGANGFICVFCTEMLLTTLVLEESYHHYGYHLIHVNYRNWELYLG